MIFLKKIMEWVSRDLDMVDVRNLKFRYDTKEGWDGEGNYDEIDNRWYANNLNTYYDCILSLYPKEWLISE